MSTQNERHPFAGRELRAAGKRQKPKESFLKRHLKEAGATLVVLTIAGGVIFERCKQTPSPEQPFPRPISTASFRPEPTHQLTSLTSEQVVLQEITRLQIQRDREEQFLWEAFGKKYQPNHAEMTDEQLLQEAQDKVFTTLTLMNQSKNPYFQDVTSYLTPLIQNNEITFVYEKDLSVGNTESTLSTGIRVENERLQWILTVSAEEIVRNASPLTLAPKIAHEITHIRNDRTYLQSFPTIQEKLQRHETRRRNPVMCLAEESDGYRMEAVSHLHQVGLTGEDKTAPHGELDKYSAFLIKSNYETRNELWQLLIRDIAPHCLQ